jgi:adenine-specific DNA-methyltransferase
MNTDTMLIPIYDKLVNICKTLELLELSIDTVILSVKSIDKPLQNLGQYFTTNLSLQETVYKFIQNKPKCILEPCIGRGDLVIYISNKLQTTFDKYEIDKSIKFLDDINQSEIYFGDFLEQKISKKYDTIIGNPPYVRIKHGNKYIDFILRCYNLLNEEGELIFIIPSDFFKLTSASKILNIMMINGVFTHIYHPHNENLFEGASIDIIVFRYCKSKTSEKIINYNNKKMYITNSLGMITFSDNKPENIHMFKDFFNVYVGIVSGKESVYKNDKLGNIKVLNGKDKLDNYIYINKFPSKIKKINEYLLTHKEILLNRHIRKFNDTNWFEWGAPRNITTIQKNIGNPCIYVYNLSRNKQIAFVGTVGLFGGSLIMLQPKSNINIKKIVKFINSNEFKQNFTFSGRFKIGHRQISHSFIPASIIDNR